jgi:hypothetical protein
LKEEEKEDCTSCILPSVTPGAQTEEPANTVSTSSTLNLDSFIGSCDKGDKKKLEGERNWRIQFLHHLL